MTLPQRPLGNTGIAVSVLGLGAAKLGRTGAMKMAPFPLPSMRQAKRLLDRARGLGVNLIDTAPAYGESEARLGELLAGRRGGWVLSTKAGERFDGRASHHDFSFAAVRDSVEASLKRLRTDYIDIVFVHSHGHDLEILRAGEALEALRALRQAGKVRAIGFSHKGLAGARLALASCDAIMSHLSHRRRLEREVVAEAGRRHCGVLVKKALDSGAAAPESLGWVSRQAGVTSVLVGTVDAEHLEADVAAVCAGGDAAAVPDHAAEAGSTTP